MTKLRFAPATARLIEQYEISPAHATLLTGRPGTGLFALAGHMATMNGRILTIIRPEAKTSTSVPTINVERIRRLYTETKTKLDGNYFVILDDADAMNHVAQNALLKLLEEPNESIHFILTSHAPDKLLPTIRSRTQIFSVPPLATLESKRLLKSIGGIDIVGEQRLLFVADGLPAELTRLATNQSDFKILSEQVQLARTFVEGSTYHKLTVIQAVKDDRQAALKFIETTVLLLRRSIASASSVQKIRVIDELMKASDAIRANGNIRLHLFRAVLR